jgi:hypothetical protein
VIRKQCCRQPSLASHQLTIQLVPPPHPRQDVESFLTNPLSCIFGDDTTGGISDFITDITDSAITSVMSDAIIPLAVEAFSGLAWLELLFGQVYSVLGIVDDIIDVVDSIAGVGGDIPSTFSSIFRVSATTSAIGISTGPIRIHGTVSHRNHPRFFFHLPQRKLEAGEVS